jgi:hypothetical protein
VSRNYRVYNLQGALVLEGRFGDGVSSGSGSSNGGSSNGGRGSGNGGSDSNSIPTANLPNGTYFLQFDGEKSRNITSKFIVQH